MLRVLYYNFFICITSLRTQLLAIKAGGFRDFKDKVGLRKSIFYLANHEINAKNNVAKFHLASFHKNAHRLYFKPKFRKIDFGGHCNRYSFIKIQETRTG
jgi:hypothetical protein